MGDFAHTQRMSPVSPLEHSPDLPTALPAPGPWGEIRIVDAQTLQRTQARYDAAVREHPWLAKLQGPLDAIVRADVTHRKRLSMLRALADRINAVLAPYVACRPNCASCCHIAVEISGWEATQIGRELGLRVREVRNSIDTTGGINVCKESAERWLGQACGFLKDGRCSIYANRPLACRLHHNLDDSPAQCSTDIPINESLVPTMDFQLVWVAYAALSVGTAVGDLSEFFAEAERRPKETREVL